MLTFCLHSKALLYCRSRKSIRERRYIVTLWMRLDGIYVFAGVVCEIPADEGVMQA